MKFQVRYHNKPHDLRLSNIHICTVAKGIWLVSCEWNLRGYDINSHGSGPGKGESVFFGDDDHMRAELILYPETTEEKNLSLTVANIYKRTYYAIMVSTKRLNSAWDLYCKNQYAKLLKRRKRKGVECERGE